MKISNEKTDLRIRLTPSCIMKDGCGIARPDGNKDTTVYFIGIDVWRLLELNPALTRLFCVKLSKAMNISNEEAIAILADDDTQAAAGINIAYTGNNSTCTSGIVLYYNGDQKVHELYSCRFSPSELRTIRRYLSEIQRAELAGNVQKVGQTLAL